jgi:tetratricopeptide (TPR) repeat protein
MKKINALAFCMLICSCFVYGQINKKTLKVEALYNQNKFNEVIKFKRFRTNSLPAKVLYYKGMSYLKQDDLNKALIMFDKAIDKGPADVSMYFQKSIIHSENKQYKKAIASINQAILLEVDNPDLHALKGEIYYYKEDNDSALISLNKATTFEGCDVKTYILIGEIKREKKEYLAAYDNYLKALGKAESKSDYHNFCSYSIAAMQQELNNLEEAKRLFIKHLDVYADDFTAIMKLIQVNTSLALFDENKDLRKQIYNADKKNLSKNMKKSFCFEIFNWKENEVFGIEMYNPKEDKAIYAKYKYIAYDKSDKMVLKINAELDSTKMDSTLTLKLVKNDTCYTYNNLQFNYNPDFKKLSITVKELLENKYLPSDTLINYSAWTNKIKMKRSSLAQLERDGSSFKKAVIASSIPMEYEWLREYFPGYKFYSQSLVFEGNKPYDILNIETIDGTKIDVYFDISSFFGKGF